MPGHASAIGKRKRQDVQLQPDDCCTPELGKAQAAAQAATTVKAGARSPGSKKLHPKTTGKQVSNKAAIQAMPGDGSSQRSVTGMKQGQGRRSSRLASATPAADSQPESHTLEPHSDAPDAAAQETMRQSSSAVVPDSDDEDMPDAGPSDGHSEGTVQAIGSAELGENNEQRTQAKCKAPGVVPVLLPGGSSRFSARHLKQKMEAKLPVSKATPIGLPPTPMLPATQQYVLSPLLQNCRQKSMQTCQMLSESCLSCCYANKVMCAAGRLCMTSNSLKPESVLQCIHTVHVGLVLYPSLCSVEFPHLGQAPLETCHSHPQL